MGDLEDRLPAPVRTATLEPGSTVFHGHPRAQEVFELVLLLRLDSRERPSLLKEALSTEFPDLEYTPGQLDYFLDRYVDPHAVAPPGFFRRGLLRAGASLNPVREIAQAASEMKAQWLAERDNINRVYEFDEKGKPVVVGPTASEWVGMGRDVIEAYKDQFEAQARIGMAPPKPEKGGAPVVVVQQNNPPPQGPSLKDAMGTGWARPAAPAQPPVDAEFRDTPPVRPRPDDEEA